MLDEEQLIIQRSDYSEKPASDRVQMVNNKMKKNYQFPGNIKQAEIHKQAYRYGIRIQINQKDNESKSEKIKICPCCDTIINTQPLPMNYQTTPNIFSPNQSQYLMTSGKSLFFTFVKMSIYYLLMRFIVTDAYNILTSTIVGTYCDDNSQCSDSYLVKFSSYNKYYEEHLIYILDVLDLVTVCLSIIFFMGLRKLLYMIQQSLNSSQYRQHDYTIFCTNIPFTTTKPQKLSQEPFEYTHKLKLKLFFENKINIWLRSLQDLDDSSKPEFIQKQFLQLPKQKNPLDQYKIRTISLCFDLSNLQTLLENRKKLMQTYESQYKTELQRQLQGYTSEIEQQRLIDIPAKINQLIDQEVKMNQQSKSKNYVGKAFISFEYQHYRDYILRQYERNKKFLQFQPGKYLIVEQAVSPRDVNWLNMKVDNNTRSKYYFFGSLILLMILAFAFAGVVGISLLKIDWHNKQVQEESVDANNVNVVLVLFAAILTIIINGGLQLVARALSKYERHSTRSYELINLLIKTIITQFVNTALIYYFVDRINHEPYMSSQGLVIQITNFFFASAALQIVINLINPLYLIRKVRIKKWKGKQKVNLFQINLNKEMQLPIYDMADRYSYYLLQIYISAFYSYLTPITCLVSIITFIIQYWIDKYNLFRKSSVNYEIDSLVSNVILKITQFSLIVFVVGNLIFSIVLHDGYVNYINLVSVVLAVIYIAFIMFSSTSLDRKIFAHYEKIETKTYSMCQKEDRFKSTYWTSNPATRLLIENDINTQEQINIKLDQIRIAEEKDLAISESYLGFMKVDSAPLLRQKSQG